MAEPVQATPLAVYDAGQSRLTDLGRAIVALEADYQPTDKLDASACHLRFGLEALFALPDPEQALRVQAYVQETYALPQGGGTDPVGQPGLPTIPSQGAQVRPRVLLVNGRPVLVNGQPLIVGYRLVAVTGPTYNTTLLPTQTAGPVTYNGLVNTELSFDAPLPTGGALYLRLYVAGVQVGRVDFPAAATGAGFSLLYQGVLYYGTFQTTSDNTLTLS